MDNIPPDQVRSPYTPRGVVRRRSEIDQSRFGNTKSEGATSIFGVIQVTREKGSEHAVENLGSMRVRQAESANQIKLAQSNAHRCRRDVEQAGERLEWHTVERVRSRDCDR